MGEGVGVPGYVLLCLLCFILYAPWFASIPPVDRDQARFAQATRQMLETGDFIRTRLQKEARNKKTIGIHWLQAAAVALRGTPGSTAIWPYRLPSALAATTAVLFTSVLGATLLSSRRAGSVAGVTTASAVLLKGPAAPALALVIVATQSIADRNIPWIKAFRPIDYSAGGGRVGHTLHDLEPR